MLELVFKYSHRTANLKRNLDVPCFKQKINNLLCNLQ